MTIDEFNKIDWVDGMKCTYAGFYPPKEYTVSCENIEIIK